VTEELTPKYDLIERMFTFITKNCKTGAILIFMPGWNEIMKTVHALEMSSVVSRNPKNFRILPLHSSVAPNQQKLIFVKPPKGVWKVVVSTNIAETSLTIDDVLYVIDSGLAKEKVFDAHTGMSSLHTTWVSQSSARQRKGRAGRVQAGSCFRLYSEARFSSMQPFQTPEMLRTPLEEICLQVKALGLDGKAEQRNKNKSKKRSKKGGGDAGRKGDCKETAAAPKTTPPSSGSIFSFLALSMDPPTPTMVETATDLLRNIGAMTPNKQSEDLTVLGTVLARMPCDPRMSKMLIYACGLKCLNPMLTIAACVSSRSPFVLAMPHEREMAHRAKQLLAQKHQSDVVALINAYDGWERVMKRGGGAELGRYCRKHFISSASMKMIRSIKGQLFRFLKDARAVPPSTNSPQDESLNSFSSSITLIKALVAIGAYPNVAFGERKAASGKRKGAASRNGKFQFTTRDHMKNIKVHPSSVNRSSSNPSASLKHLSHPHIIFFEVMRSTDVFLHTTSTVSPLSLALFTGTLEALSNGAGNDKSGDKNSKGSKEEGIQVDDFLKWRCSKSVMSHLSSLRAMLDLMVLQNLPGTARLIKHSVKASRSASGAGFISPKLSQEVGQIVTRVLDVEESLASIRNMQEGRHSLWGLEDDSGGFEDADDILRLDQEEDSQQQHFENTRALRQLVDELDDEKRGANHDDSVPGSIVRSEDGDSKKDGQSKWDDVMMRLMSSSQGEHDTDDSGQNHREHRSDSRRGEKNCTTMIAEHEGYNLSEAFAFDMNSLASQTNGTS